MRITLPTSGYSCLSVRAATVACSRSSVDGGATFRVTARMVVYITGAELTVVQAHGQERGRRQWRWIR